MALPSSSSSPKLLLSHSTSLVNPTPQFCRTRPFLFRIARHGPRVSVSALADTHAFRRRNCRHERGRLGDEVFASVSSSTSGELVSSVGVNSQSVPPLPPPSSHVGSPLFWIGVGVGLSAFFSWVASYLKKYAMQQAFKTLMNQMNAQNNPLNNPAFSPASPFPFPMPSSSGPGTSSPSGPAASYPTSSVSGRANSPSPVASESTITVDVPVTKIEPSADTDVTIEADVRREPKKNAFVDVSPDETLLNTPFRSAEDGTETKSFEESQPAEGVSQNGAASKQDSDVFESSQSSNKSGPILSVEALEKMMEDPTVQKMVYPYLPEEMRNPSTFKWMLQNPQYRQQLQDMLNNMGGSGEWDNQMMESLKNFDLSSPEVKQQFDQIGLTPEEVISKIMANPDVALAFQNPRVQQAIMDCSQNPLSIAKYQNDKEVMDVFNKISELFPGVSGSP